MSDKKIDEVGMYLSQRTAELNQQITHLFRQCSDLIESEQYDEYYAIRTKLVLKQTQLSEIAGVQSILYNKPLELSNEPV